MAMTAADGKELGRVTSGSHRTDLNSVEWEASDTPGFYLKTIFRDEVTGESTQLMKMDPGARSESHSHDMLEEIFVLEGGFEDADHDYKAGQYCMRAIGAEHQTISKGGGVVLLIYRK
jgi:anti-sigma factor ChrR (cupin superfamily)